MVLKNFQKKQKHLQIFSMWKADKFPADPHLQTARLDAVYEHRMYRMFQKSWAHFDNEYLGNY